MEVDQFARGRVDDPVTFGVVAVASRETHRGHGASRAIQDLRAATARCYTGKKEGDNRQEIE